MKFEYVDLVNTKCIIRTDDVGIESNKYRESARIAIYSHRVPLVLQYGDPLYDAIVKLLRFAFTVKEASVSS